MSKKTGHSIYLALPLMSYGWGGHGWGLVVAALFAYCVEIAWK